MPTVPRYQRHVSLPGAVPQAEGSLHIAGLPGQALGDIGQSLAAMAERDMEARRVSELTQYTLEAVQDLDELNARTARTNEWEKIIPGYEAGIKELRTKYKEKITDPAVRNLFSRDFEKMALRGLAEARATSHKKEKDHHQASLLNTLDAYSDMTARAVTFDQAAETLKFGRAAIAGAVAAGTLDEVTGSKWEKDFIEKAQVNFIRREMLADPEAVHEGLISGQYPELDETRKTELLKASQVLAEAAERKRIHVIEQAERQAEKAKKDAQENAYGDALALYSQGALTEATVQRLLSSRRIDPDKGSHLISMIRGDERRGDKVENNPRVIGDLSVKLELGMDITPALEQALEKNEIKPDIYVSLKKQAADRDFKRGLYHVNYALKPSEADQWTPDKHIRHAEAVEEYSTRVAAGEAPLAVAKSIVGNFTSDVRRTIRGIPAPRFLDGDKMNAAALQEAERRTVEAFRKGTISHEDFNRESERLRNLFDLAKQLEQNTQADPEADDRLKGIMKKK